MAYYYFDPNDHVSTSHSEDIYVVANVGNYHDYNGQMQIDNYFQGFYLGKGGLKFTLGGNYRTKDADTDLWNIYQSVRGTSQSKKYAAVGFTGNGTFIINAQIGAPDAAKHDDRNIKIHASNQLTINGYKAIAPTLSGGLLATTPAPAGWNPNYDVTAQNADVSGIHATGTLTIGSNFNGYITVEGIHQSIGMENSAGNALINTALDTSSISTGFRGDTTVRFNGAFYGNLRVSQETFLQSTNKTLTGNISAAYGVWSNQNIEQKKVWSGNIMTEVHNNFFDATISYAYGKYDALTAANGNLSNNTIESICIKAQNIHITRLDWEEIKEDGTVKNFNHGAYTPIVEYDRSAAPSDIQYEIDGKTVTSKTDLSSVSLIPNDSPYYYIDAPQELVDKYDTLKGSNYHIYKDGVLLTDDAALVAVSTNKGNVIGSGGTTKIVLRFPRAYLLGQQCRDDFQTDAENLVNNPNALDGWVIKKGQEYKYKFDTTVAPGDLPATYRDYPTSLTLQWSGTDLKPVNGQYIFTFENGNPLVLNASEVTINGTTCTYNGPKVTVSDYYQKTPTGYYEYSSSGLSVTENTNNSGIYFTFVSTSPTVSDLEVEFDLIRTSNEFTSEYNKIADETNFSSSVTSLGNGFYLHTYTPVGNHFLLSKAHDNHIVLSAEALNNIMKVDGDLTPPADTMTGNIIQAVALDGKDKVEIVNFTKDSVIEATAKDNKMQSQISGGDTGNKIAAIGIKADTVQLHDFNGEVRIKATGNRISTPDDSNGLVFAGIDAKTLNVSKNLYGTFSIEATSNGSSWTTQSSNSRGDDYITSGQHSNIKSVITTAILADNVNIDGFIESDITVNSNNGSNTFTAGIYVTETLNAKGFSGYIHVDDNNRSMKTFGIYADTFDSEIGYYFDDYDYYFSNGQIGRLAYIQDVFNVEGMIIVNGDNAHAIATRNTANLHLNGTIVTNTYSYAVKTDYAHDVSSGFNNDWVTLGEKADVTGIIDLGGGKNRLTFDSSAKFTGHVVHDVGETNITYNLNGNAQADTIHNVTSVHDATLTSGSTITINCNNIKIGETYKLINYQDYMDIADERWLNSYVNVTYQGKNNVVYLHGGVSDVVELTGNSGDKFYVRIVYDETDNILSVESDYDKTKPALPEDIVKPVTNISVVSIKTTVDPISKAETEVVDMTDKNMLSVFNSAMKNLNNNSTPDYVTYDIDEASRTATANSTIYWMCDNGSFRNGAYEIEYTVKDANGNVVSSAMLRMTAVDVNNNAFSGTVTLNGYNQPAYGKVYWVNDNGKTQEQILRENPTSTAPFNGTYYIMSYDINNIPEGCTVEYKVRDYVTEGEKISEWISGSVNTNLQDFHAEIDELDAQKMVALNPDTKTQDLTTSMALLTWNAAASNYTVDKYTIQYFTSSENLAVNDAKRQLIFDAYTYADKTKTNWQDVVDEHGNVVTNSKGFKYEIRFVKTANTQYEIQIRETVDQINVFGQSQSIYQYYNFVNKEVSSTELLISGLSDQTHIYWRVQATASDASALTTNWTEGKAFTVNVDNSPNIPPTPDPDEDDPALPPEDPDANLAPTGTFSSLKTPVLVPEFKNVQQQVIEDGKLKVDENGQPVMETVEVFNSADITFTWTDNFVANSTGAEIYYLFQVSNSEDFDTERTETILLIPASMSDSAINRLYATLSAKYENLKVFNTVDSWRAASGSNYTTTVTFDNSYPTIPVGMFANKNNYWQVKAVDSYGNEADYCNVQQFKPTYTVKETYTEINPETGEEEIKERDVVKYITDLAPAKAYDLGITTPEQENGKNTGKIEFEFKVNHDTMGFDKIAITINGKNVAGTKLATDVMTIESAVLSEQTAISNMTEFTQELFDIITVDGQEIPVGYLVDGTYTVTVTTYNSSGTAVKSDNFTFVQDTTRPVIQSNSTGGTDTSTISAVFAKQDSAVKDITVTLSWPLATDNFDTKSKSNIKGYYLWYKSSDVSEWQAVRINDSTLLTKTTYDVTLTNGEKYDFKVVAVDMSNNLSEAVEVKGIEIIYKDVDDDYVKPVIPPLYAPFSLRSEVIGAAGDPVDKIHVSTDNNTNNPARLVFSVKNLQQARGKGNAITISLYEDDGGLTLLKTYTVKGTSSAKTSAGLTFEYLLAESGKQYVFEIKSANETTVMKYDFDYECMFFAKDTANDTPYQLAPSYVTDFDSDHSAPTVLPVDPAGQLTGTSVSLRGSSGDPKQSVGFGDSVNYNRLLIDTDGKYTLNISKDEKDANSALKVVIYQAVPGSTSLKAIKTVTVAANKTEAVIKDLELGKGEYVIQVSSPSASKGANINYTVSVSTQNDKYYSLIDNTDDSYHQSKINTHALKNGETVIFGEVAVVQGEEVIYSDFIGKADSADFKKVTIATSGNYTFDLSKITYLNLTQEKEIAYGSDGKLTFTIYEAVEGKTALKKVKSVTVAANKFEQELNAYLNAGEYYFEVKADSKTAVYYDVVMSENVIELDGKTYKAEGQFNINDGFVFEQTIGATPDQVYYFNNESSVELAKSTYEYVGFGEANNFFKVSFEKDGDYTFFVNTYDDREKNKKDSLAANYSPLKAVIYKANEDGNGFTVVKTVTLSANKASASAELKNLAAGDYYIAVTATNAAKGKYALYNLSLKTNHIVNNSNADVKANSNFVEALAYAVNAQITGTAASDDPDYYKFSTASVAGSYNFNFGTDGDYKVYILKDGAVKLTELKLDANNSAYIDANTQVYIGITTENAQANYEFSVNADPMLSKDISSYNNDNNAYDAENNAASLAVGNAAGASDSFSSWVGYGDLESWRKLTLDDAGSFNLKLQKTSQAADTKMTVTVYQFTDNGTSPKAIGSFVVNGNVYEGMKNFKLNAGEYYIQVKSNSAQGNAEFELSVNGDSSVDPNCFIAKADNSDDTSLSVKVINANGGSTQNEWVGYTDEYDYFNIDVASSGYYDFKLANADATQVVLYVVNPANSKLTAIGTYSVKEASAGAENMFSCLLNSNSQYIAMVKSTNAAKGGNNDYTLSVDKTANKYDLRFTISDEEAGKYTFVDNSADIDFSDFIIEKYNSSTGKLTTVKLDANDQLKLTAGDYFLTAATDAITKVNLDIDDNAMIITLK